MAFLVINPVYRDVLEQQGLISPEMILALPAVIISGHPDRNVAEVTIGTGPSALAAFLKQEHRVLWRDRIRNVWAGFGWVSKSYREYLTLRAAHEAGVGCPEWIAVGKDRQGRAFLLLRKLNGTVDLRWYLRERLAAPVTQRRRFAQELGQTLARMHAAGFDHPDLYSKHILVNPLDLTIRLLDWQRSRLRRFVSWRRRWHDLAVLDATLAEDLATVRERLVCLRAYLRQFPAPAATSTRGLRQSALCILAMERDLLRRRRIRELRQMPSVHAKQNLVWRDGEALCLTASFHEAVRGQIPQSLFMSNLPARPRNLEVRTLISVPAERWALLVRRRQCRWLGRLWAWISRRPLVSPEIGQAGLLFRLQRWGIGTPQLLAFGQRLSCRGGIESFLLTEPPAEAISLHKWLSNEARFRPSGAQPGQRRRLVQEAALLLRRLHDARWHLGEEPRLRKPAMAYDCPFRVQQNSQNGPRVILGNVDSLRPCRRLRKKLALRDLVFLRRHLAGHLASRTDEMRFLVQYLEVRHLTPDAKRYARLIIGSCPASYPPRTLAAPAPARLQRAVP